MGWNGDHMSGWGYLFMGSGTLAFWAIVITAVVVLSRASDSEARERRRHPERRPSPDQILAERFARGDIDDDEYRRRLEALSRE